MALWRMRKREKYQPPVASYQLVLCVRKLNLILTWFLSWWRNIFLFYIILHPTSEQQSLKAMTDPISILSSWKVTVSCSWYVCIVWCGTVAWDNCNGSHHQANSDKKKENTSETWQIGLNLLKILCIWLKLRDKNCSNPIETCECEAVYICLPIIV